MVMFFLTHLADNFVYFSRNTKYICLMKCSCLHEGNVVLLHTLMEVTKWSTFVSLFNEHSLLFFYASFLLISLFSFLKYHLQLFNNIRLILFIWSVFFATYLGCLRENTYEISFSFSHCLINSLNDIFLTFDYFFLDSNNQFFLLSSYKH